MKKQKQAWSISEAWTAKCFTHVTFTNAHFSSITGGNDTVQISCSDTQSKAVWGSLSCSDRLQGPRVTTDVLICR